MNPLSRTIMLLLFIIIIPIMVYAFLQIKSLNEDEKRSQFVYEKQMETLLFSLNQYADDLMTQWIGRLSNQQEHLERNGMELILNNESIQMLVLRNMASKTDNIFLADYVKKEEKLNQKINNWYTDQDSVLSQLTNYLSAGFQKIQAVEEWEPIGELKPDQVGMTVMIYAKDSILYNVLIVVEPNYWVEQILGAKMQALNQDDFCLAVFKSSEIQETSSLIFSTNPFEIEKSYVSEKLWILPDMYLAIQPRGISYTELIKERSNKNLYFLFFSMLTVLIGTWLIIKNIRSTLKIAQLKSDFVSNVSHEIRTPLSLIRMYAETLMLGRLSSEEKKKHYYQIIHHESGRLTYLVNNILDFSRIEADRKTYHPEDRNLNEMVQNIQDNFTYYFSENKVNCKLELANDPIHISVDSQAFEEALSNLIENAIKYKNGTDRIEISTFVSSGFGCCQVTDFGIGISKKDQKNIFDKFYRVEDSLTQKTKGVGLGLSLVKHIMESHHGEITVASEIDHGSSFTLKFPIIQS